MLEKKEQEYIGRYGEILENVREIKDSYFFSDENCIFPRKNNMLILEGIGLNKKGEKRKVIFQVSTKSHTKEGPYEILYTPQEEQLLAPIYPGSEGNLPKAEEICYYVNDRLHGEDRFYHPWVYSMGYRGMEPDYSLFFYRGRQMGSAEGWEREEMAKKALAIRRLLSDPSIVEAIKTANPLEVKNTATRIAMTKTQKKEKE